jgi:hypothetical protein
LSTAPSRGGEGLPRGEGGPAWAGVDPGFVGRGWTPGSWGGRRRWANSPVRGRGRWPGGHGWC